MALTGKHLISSSGDVYRVIETTDDVVSMKRVNGFTIIALKSGAVATLFRPYSEP
jgi:hypothetical protein